MLTIIEQLKEHADLVILDTPPVLGVSDTLELASIVDAALLTVDATHEKKSSLRDMVGDLHSVGATILGVLLHRPDQAHVAGYNCRYGHREDAERSAEMAEEAPRAAEAEASPRRAPAAAPIRDVSEPVPSGRTLSSASVDEHQAAGAASARSSTGGEPTMRGRLWPS
jgi:receptor protein-tyrosine kinase